MKVPKNTYTTPKELPPRNIQKWIDDDRDVLYNPTYKAMVVLEQVEEFRFVETYCSIANGEINS